MKDYSQNQEQAFILDYFKNHSPGFFWDIGAGDGVSNSNTRALWKMDWNGVLFEPSPLSFDNLCRNYHFRGKDTARVTLINCAVVPPNLGGLDDLSECEIQGWSSLHREWVDSWVGKTKTSAKVLCLSIEYLAQILPVPDFLSIDTEGLDASILEVFPPRFHPGLVMAETDKPGAHERIDAAMPKHGYVKIWQGLSNAAYEYRQA